MNAITKFSPATAVAAIVAVADLTAALTAACRVLPSKRSTVPVLEHVKLSAVDGGMRVEATDLDRYATAFVPGAVDRSFAVLVPGKLLLDTCKKADAEHVAIDSAGEAGISLDFGGVRITLQPKAELADFPEWKPIDEGGYFTLPTADPEDRPR